MSKPKDEKLLSVRLEVALFKLLEKMGKRDDLTVSQIARKAIREFVDRDQKPAAV